MNWIDTESRRSVEMNDKSFRPALADKRADIAAYDTILLGFPLDIELSKIPIYGECKDVSFDSEYID